MKIENFLPSLYFWLLRLILILSKNIYIIHILSSSQFSNLSIFMNNWANDYITVHFDSSQKYVHIYKADHFFQTSLYFIITEQMIT